MHQKLASGKETSEALHEEKKKSLTKKQLIAVSVVAGSFILIGMVFLLFSSNSQPKSASTLPTPIMHSTTIVTPITATSLLSFQNESATTSSVILDTGNKPVSTVQLEIGFDPLVLSNITIKPAQFFQKALVLENKVDYTKGIIFFAMVIPSGGTQRAGKGTVAEISYSFNQGAINPTTLQFLPRTKVTGEGIVQSVLKSAKGLTISSGF